MREHLKGIACEAAEMAGKPRARVLDIGCNDGTLLRHYPDDFEKYGIDPSDIVEEIGDEIRVVRDRFPSERLTSATEGRRFDIITSIAMFYDLEDPIGFVREIKSHLSTDAIWIFEMAYLPTTIGLTSYDTICHEHLEYYSLAVLEYITKQAGMKIFRASLNDINGGSIRCYATHRDAFVYDQSCWLEQLRELRLREFELGLESDAPYDAFRVRVRANIEKLTGVLKRLRQEGKRIHIYGASTKGNTILQACGLDRSILECAADRNPEKHGARIIGSEIPIVSEEESRSMNPDYYLVLPWHFRDEFLQRERETIKRGVGMIFPLPEVDIVTSSNLPQAR
jgi:SAM-dependent methyltransferase